MRDDTSRPAPQAGDRQPVPPAMLAAAPPGGAALSPLDSADASFRALTAGPQPLALHAASLAAGLPDRLVPLDELRALLLHPATGARARNKVWAELVRRARLLRDLVAGGKVPLSWIPPEQARELRGLLQLYRDLTQERMAWAQRIHATLFHQGVPSLAGRIFGPRPVPRSPAARTSRCPRPGPGR